MDTTRPDEPNRSLTARRRPRASDRRTRVRHRRGWESILVAAAMLGTVILAAPVQGAFVTTGTLLGGTAFAGWGGTGTYTVSDDSDGGGIQAEQNIVNFHTAIGTTNGGTDPPSASNPISHLYFRIDSGSTATNKWGKMNIQMNLGSGAAGQVDHILQVVPTAAGTAPIVELYSYDATQAVGAFTSGSITLRASNQAGSPSFQSGVLGNVATWSGAQYGWEIAVPVAWFSSPIAPGGNLKADGTGVQSLFGAVFSSTGSIGAVGTVKDALHDATGTIRVLNTNLITGTSTFQGVTATQLAFTAHPQSANTGATLGTITVEIRDGSGTKVSTATHDVTLAIGTNPASGTLSGTTTVTAVAGVATFTGLSINAAGTGYTLVASAPGLTSATSNTFDITAAQTASQLGIQTQPSATATAGVVFAQQPVVLIQDSGGSTVTTDSTTQVTAAIISGSGTLLGTTTQTASSGVVTFTDLKTNTASTITIRFTATGLTSVTSNSIVVSAAAADPTTTTASVPNGNVASATTITITVRDAFNNPVTGQAANLAVSISGANTATPSVSETGGGQYTASYTPLLVGTDSVAITLSSTAISGSPYSSVVGIGSASKLGIQTQPSSTATAGVVFAQQPVVLVQDSLGNTVLTDSSTQVTATIKTGSGTLLGTTTVTASNGVATFTNLKTNTAATITIEFTATGLTAVTSNNVVVSAAAADPTTSTATVPAGTAGSATTITITVRDAFNNPVTGEAANLAVSISGANTATPSVSETGGGQYTASYTPTNVGTDSVAITLSSTAISGSPYSSVVSAGTATKLGIQTQPSSTATAGVAFAQQPIVLIQDAAGNTITSDSTTQVTATIKTGSGTLLGTTTVTASSGVATFTNLKTNTAATITIEFTATGLTAVTSNSITVGPAAADASQTTATVPAGTAGSATTITITVRDAFGNTVTGEAANLAVAVSGANTATPSVSEAGSGTYTASYTPTTAGTDSVAITLSSTAISGSPYSSVVSAGTASALAIQTQPSSTGTAGVTFAQQPVVLIKDANGNTVTGDSSTQVTAAIFSGSGTLLGTTTVTASNGVVTFTDLKTNTASTITLRFTATGLTAVTSTSITVSAAAADASQTTATVPAGTVGVATTITITVRDAFGNLVTGAAGLLVVAVTGANTASPTVSETGGGQYSAQYTPTSAGTDSVAITLSSSAISGSPYSSVVSAGTATKLGIQTQPSSTATAGVAFAQQPVVLIQDAAGNTVTSDSTTQVTATIKTGSGSLLGTTTVTASNGVATFTNLKTNTAATITIELTATGLTAVTSNSITVGAAAADATTTTATVPAGTAGSSTTITITVKDAFGNTVTGEAANLAVSVSGANTATPSVSEVGNGVYTASYTPTATGTDSVAITLSSTAISGSPYSSVVSAGSATKLGIQTQPSSTATAGTVFAQQPVVLIQDANGNTVTGDSSTQVTAAIFSGSGTLLGTTTVTASNGVVTFTDLKTNTASTITLRFTATGLTGVTSNSIAVAAGTADASTTTATVPGGTVGVATTITITVKDAFGNLVTGAAGLLVIAVTGANTASPTVSETGGGSYTATYTPTSSGTDSVAITLDGSAISGSPYSSTVSAGTATKLGIQTQPSSTATAGTVFAQQPVVLIQDTNGNTVTGDSTTQVTATIKTGTGTLLGTTTVTASNGVATFTNLKTNTASTITIEFTATGLTAVTSNSVTVGAAGADPTTTTATVPAGTVGSATTISITVKDAFGNTVTGESANLAVSVSGANTATPSVTEVGSGVYTATYTPTASGTDSIAITLSSTAISGSPYRSTVSAGTASKLGIQTQPSSTATAGTVFAQQPVILIQDANGNTVTGDSTTQVTATIKTGTGTLLGTTTVTAASGVATFTNLKTNTASTITIEFTATGLAAVTSNSIAVSAAAADASTTTATVGAGTVGSATTITITVKDAFGNTVTGEAANLAVAVSGANTATPSITEVGNGVYTASYTPTSSGTDSIAITLSGTAISGSPYSSTVSAGTASKLGIQTQPSSTATAGAVFAQQPVVLVQDSSGNTVTGDSTTQITATIKTGSGTLLGTTTVTAANGVATFTNLKTNTASTITIEFTAIGLTAVTSGSITVSAAAADASTTTATVGAGTVGSSTTITITVKDAFGNTVTGEAANLAVAVSGANTATPSITEVGSGVYTATYTPTASGTDSIAITLSSTAISGSPYSSTVSAGTASKLGIQTQPSSTATAGTVFAQQPVVLIQDSNGNTVTADSSTQVTATIKTGTGTLLGTTTVTASNGVATFTNLKTNTASTITIEFTATGLTAVTSGSIAVGAAAADASTTTATVGAGTVGSATTITMTVKDAFGNTVTGEAANLAVAVSGANTATPSVTEVGNGVYTASYTPTSSGTDSIAITLSGTAISGSPYSSTVSAGTASKLGIQTQPSSTATAGTVFAQQPVVLVQDSSGNTVTGDSTTQITAAIKTGSGTLLGTTTVTASNGVATFTNLKTNTAETITIEFTATGLTAVTSSSIAVSAAAADASTTTATVGAGTVGSATTITITVKDAFGNTVTGEAANLAVAVSGANTATPSITEVGNGVYTATYTPTASGTDSIAITLSSTAISGSPYSSTVSAGTASKLGIQTQPSSTATAGTVFAQQPVILIQDANGNTVTSDSTTQVTATIKTGTGTLLGTTTVTAASGAASFTNLKTNTASTITIEFTATGLTAVTSTSITVSAAAPDATSTTATVPAGTPGTTTSITITVKDAFGNLVTGAAASLAGSVTGTNTATLTVTEVGNGVYTATYTPTTAGTDTIAITAGGTAISGSPFTSTVGTITITITDPTPAARDSFLRGGAARTITVTGTGFQNGLTATISGRNVAVNFVTFVSSTEVKLNITVDANATPGNRTITLTNPDATTASSRGIYLEALPEPVIDPQPVTPYVGQNVTFLDASSSEDWRASIALWTWDFGDGATSTSASPTHQYASAGSYTVTLTVTDSRGHTGTSTKSVTVETVPSGFHTHVIADDDARVEIGTSLTFQQLTTGGTGPYNHTWNARGLTTWGNSATRSFTTLGSFPLTLTSRDASGQQVEDTITVHVYRPNLLTEPETVTAGGQKVVSTPEGDVTLTANGSKTPTAHVRVDIGNSPEAVGKNATLKFDTGNTQAARYMAVTVFDEHDLLDFDRVRLQFNYTDADIQGLDESSLAVWYWNGTQWLNTMNYIGSVMPGASNAQNRTVYEAGIDVVNNFAWAVVNQPSEYSLAGRRTGGGGGGHGVAPSAPQPSVPGSEATGFDRMVSLTLNAVDEGAQLTWTPSEPFAAETLGYQVWRSTSPWTMVANVSAATTSFLDDEAPAGAKYKVTYYVGYHISDGYVSDPALLHQLPGWNPDEFARYDPILPPADAVPVVPDIPAPQPVAAPQWVFDVLMFILIATLAYAIAQGVRIGRGARESLQLRRVWSDMPDIVIDTGNLTGDARKLIAEMRQLRSTPHARPKAQGIVLEDARRMAATFAALGDARRAQAARQAASGAPPARLAEEARQLLHTMHDTALAAAGEREKALQAMTNEARLFAQDTNEFQHHRHDARPGATPLKPPAALLAAEARHLLDALHKHQAAPAADPVGETVALRDEARHLAALFAAAVPDGHDASGAIPMRAGIGPSERVDPQRFEDALTRVHLVTALFDQLEGEIRLMKAQPEPLPAYVPAPWRRWSREAQARRAVRYEQRLERTRMWCLARDQKARSWGVKASFALAREIRQHTGRHVAVPVAAP